MLRRREESFEFCEDMCSIVADAAPTISALELVAVMKALSQMHTPSVHIPDQSDRTEAENPRKVKLWHTVASLPPGMERGFLNVLLEMHALFAPGTRHAWLPGISVMFEPIIARL